MRFTTTVKQALKEDIGAGDVTTRLFVQPDARFRATAVAKEAGILCGAGAAAEAFLAVDRKCRVKTLKKDGDALRPGDRILEVTGGRAILTAERVALNFMQRLSGVATAANKFARIFKGTGTKILDTRKTTPLLRKMEKYAVLCGGGTLHREGLYDAVLIKNNHIDSAGWDYITSRIAQARKIKKLKFIEIEARDMNEVRKAAACRPDIILLDNMTPGQIRAAVKFIKSLPAGQRPLSEISGGVTLASAVRLARLGADRISAGCITHSAKALDISLRVETK